MKKYALLTVLLVVMLVGCNSKNQKSLVIDCGGYTISYSALKKMPQEIVVKGPCDVCSHKYPITIHFPDPENPSAFTQTGGFFRQGYRARLNGTINKSRTYLIWFHSEQVRGAEYLNPIIGSTIIKLQ